MPDASCSELGSNYNTAPAGCCTSHRMGFNRLADWTMCRRSERCQATVSCGLLGREESCRYGKSFVLGGCLVSVLACWGNAVQYHMCHMTGAFRRPVEAAAKARKWNWASIDSVVRFTPRLQDVRQKRYRPGCVGKAPRLIGFAEMSNLPSSRLDATLSFFSDRGSVPLCMILACYLQLSMWGPGARSWGRIVARVRTWLFGRAVVWAEKTCDDGLSENRHRPIAGQSVT